MASLQLADIGLDLTFALHILLLRDVEKWICDGRDKLVEAVKLRGQEDTWKTLKYENKEQLNKFIEDMNDIGIASIEKYVMGECLLCCACLVVCLIVGSEASLCFHVFLFSSD